MFDELSFNKNMPRTRLNISCYCNQTAEMIAMETSYSTKALLIFFPSRLSFISHIVSEKIIYEYFFVF